MKRTKNPLLAIAIFVAIVMFVAVVLRKPAEKNGSIPEQSGPLTVQETRM